MDNHVYITLASNDTTVGPGENPGNFSNQFINPVRLDGKNVEVALHSLDFVPPVGTNIVFVNSDLALRTVQVGSQQTQELYRFTMDTVPTGSGYVHVTPTNLKWVPASIETQITSSEMSLTDESGAAITPHPATITFATFALRASPSKKIGNL